MLTRRQEILILLSGPGMNLAVGWVLNAPGFAADIPGRLLHGQQVFFNLFF